MLVSCSLRTLHWRAVLEQIFRNYCDNHHESLVGGLRLYRIMSLYGMNAEEINGARGKAFVATLLLLIIKQVCT